MQLPALLATTLAIGTHASTSCNQNELLTRSMVCDAVTCHPAPGYWRQTSAVAVFEETFAFDVSCLVTDAATLQASFDGTAVDKNGDNCGYAFHKCKSAAVW